MKPILLSFLMAVTLFTGVAQAQSWVPGEYMKQAVDNVHNKVENATNLGNYGYSKGFCFLGAYIQDGHSVKWSTSLPTGKKLIFIGGGDNDAVDVDIKIYDSEGTMVAEDVEGDNTPVLVFSTESSENYIIELSLPSTSAGGSFCCLSFLEENAPSLPLQNMEDAVENVIDYGQKANDRIKVKFHDVDNQWCLYGVNLPSGKANTVTNMDLGSYGHMFLAAGDNRIQDADLHLFDANDNVLTSDEEEDAVPLLRYTTSGNERYQLKLGNVKSSGNAMLICIVLTEEE